MAHSTNQISLYQKMDETMEKKTEMHISIPILSYYDKNEKKEILPNEEFEGIVLINEYDSMWSPNEHDLEVSQIFLFEKPSILFGDTGITMPNNKIGLAVHMHSKASNFQKTVSIGTISNSENPVQLEFYYHFPIAELRGNLELDFFLYLKENKEYNPKHASKVGMILSEGDISNLIIVIDGEGSVFPMSEFEDKTGPLWRLEKNWVEANIDTFDSSNVNLSLNVAHPLFEQVKAGKQATSRALMGDIMIQAMSMIIQQVIIIEGNSLDDLTDTLSNSILMAVDYWVSTFEVDISSMFSITNSVRAYWDRQMIEGEKIND